MLSVLEILMLLRKDLSRCSIMQVLERESRT